MSTKIYNAYKVNNMTMPQVMEKLYELKRQYLVKCEEFLMVLDFEKIKLTYGGVFDFADELRKQASNPKNDIFNWTASVMVYFHQDNIYIQHFGLTFKMDIEGIFEGNLEDYHYQNQSDPWWCYDDEPYTDDQIAEFEAEYLTRERVWDEILGDRHQFGACGLAYDVYSKEDAFDIGFNYYQKKNAPV